MQMTYYNIQKTPRTAHKNYSKLINDFSKAEDTRITFRNWLHFCTLTMKYQKKEYKNTIPFKTAPPKLNSQ